VRNRRREHRCLTKGAEGLLVRTATDTRVLTAPSVEVVDGSGAGDAFAAGLIVGILEGWPVERSLRFASVVGALACTGLGCSAGIPDRRQVFRQMSTH
jgi:5-dehydro-2-deoxygluconokinase